MKKNIMFILIIIIIACVGLGLAYLLTACGKESQDTVSKDETLTYSSEYANLIPDPTQYFMNTEFEIICNENSYTVYIDYTSEEEWEKYIKACQDSGVWTNESYRSDYSWYIYTEDKKYQLLLDRYGEKNEYLTIFVKLVQEE